MEPDEIPELPKFSDSELFYEDEEFMMKEFKKAKNKFVFYDNENNEPRFFFHQLDEKLYAGLVYLLCQSSHLKLYEFLKLLLETVRLVKLNNKKGFIMAEKIENYIKNQIKNR